MYILIVSLQISGSLQEPYVLGKRGCDGNLCGGKTDSDPARSEESVTKEIWRTQFFLLP